MKSSTIIKLTVLIVATTGLSLFLYTKIGKKQEKRFYLTEKPMRRTIVQSVRATGKLEAEGTINIGSLINGIVESLHAEENQTVKKGQLLAVVDDGKADNIVKQTKGALEQAQAQLNYQTEYYAREKKLFDAGLISKDEFQQAQQSYDSAIAQVATQDAAHKQALLEFNNKKITSPIDGIVITKHVSLREGVANFSPPTILYTLAEDISQMKVELEIDETDIGLLKVGHEAKMYFDTYPHTTFRGKIYEISSGPISATGTSVTYKACIKIDNSHGLLKPGMTAHAQIVVGIKRDAIAIPGHLFALDSRMLMAAAQQKKQEFKPLEKDAKTNFKNTLKDKNHPVKSIWISTGSAIVQKPIELGITDNAYFEVISGLNDSDDVIIDVDEPDNMLKMYKNLFGGGLGKK